MLSQYMMGIEGLVILRSLSKYVIQVSSTAVVATARYLASVLDRAEVVYFLALHEIEFIPSLDRQVCLQPAQSESENAESCKLDLAKM